MVTKIVYKARKTCKVFIVLFIISLFAAFRIPSFGRVGSGSVQMAKADGVRTQDVRVGVSVDSGGAKEKIAYGKIVLDPAWWKDYLSAQTQGYCSDGVFSEQGNYVELRFNPEGGDASGSCKVEYTLSGSDSYINKTTEEEVAYKWQIVVEENDYLNGHFDPESRSFEGTAKISCDAKATIQFVRGREGTKTIPYSKSFMGDWKATMDKNGNIKGIIKSGDKQTTFRAAQLSLTAKLVQIVERATASLGDQVNSKPIVAGRPLALRVKINATAPIQKQIPLEISVPEILIGSDITKTSVDLSQQEVILDTALTPEEGTYTFIVKLDPQGTILSPSSQRRATIDRKSVV